jgi:hypothetical protein
MVLPRARGVTGSDHLRVQARVDQDGVPGPVAMPAMSVAQAASWFGIMDSREHLDTGWTLVGGQLVHLHCAERGSSPERPTDDIDTVVDVRAAPDMLATFPPDASRFRPTFSRSAIELSGRPDTARRSPRPDSRVARRRPSLRARRRPYMRESKIVPLRPLSRPIL